MSATSHHAADRCQHCGSVAAAIVPPGRRLVAVVADLRQTADHDPHEDESCRMSD